MKNKFELVLLVITLVSILLVGCSSDKNNTVSETNASRHELTDIQKELNSVTKYGQKLYSDDKVTISLREINTAQGLVFDVTNNTQSTSFNVISLCVAVDGSKLNYNKDNHGPSEHPNDLMNLEAGKTDMLVYYRGLTHTEHQILSVAFQIELDDGTVLETVDVADYNLGSTANPEDSKINMNADYESDNLAFWYNGWTNDGLAFYIENKLDTMAVFSFYQKDNADAYFKLNGEQITNYQYVEEVWYLPAHSYGRIVLDESDVSRNDVNSIAFKGLLFKGNQTKTPLDTFDFSHEIKH